MEAVQDEDIGDIDLGAASILTTEVASNAARHGSEPIEVTVTLDDGLQVSVRDRGPGFDPSAEEMRRRGHGIRLVDRLASEWGR